MREAVKPIEHGMPLEVVGQAARPLAESDEGALLRVSYNQLTKKKKQITSSIVIWGPWMYPCFLHLSC